MMTRILTALGYLQLALALALAGAWVSAGLADTAGLALWGLIIAPPVTILFFSGLAALQGRKGGE